MIDLTCLRNDGGPLVLSLSGRMDTACVAEFNRAFNDAVGNSGGNRVVMDMSRLAYISSSGLSGLLAASQWIQQQGGNLVLCGLSGMVREVFQITGFNSMFELFDSVEAALN